MGKRLSVFFFLSLGAHPAELNSQAYVHLFEWPWKSVAKECQEVLAPAGIHAVQVSPPQEHAVYPEHPWWERYQVVSYKLESRSGNREDFSTMVQACAKVGVRIYVDAVLNHTTETIPSGQQLRGSAGSFYSRYTYPGLYSPADFNRCGRNGNEEIANWGDRWEIQNCNLVGLSDLKTGSLYVQKVLADFLRDLVDLGVAGFRVDAAKHIPSIELETIFRRVGRSFFAYHEVIDMSEYDAVRSTEYFGTGRVLNFRYGSDLSRIFREGKLAWLGDFGEKWQYVPSAKAMVFIDNHDTQRGHALDGKTLTFRDAKLYELANIFMLAWPYGYPQIMSSYRFQSSHQGPPSYSTPRCQGDWVCEHRWPAIQKMLRFRQLSADAAVEGWWSNGNNQIAFARGKLTYLVLNREAQTLDRRLQTPLAPGSYTEILSGQKIEVDTRGEFHAHVPALSAWALIPRTPDKLRSR